MDINGYKKKNLQILKKWSEEVGKVRDSWLDLFTFERDADNKFISTTIEFQIHQNLELYHVK